MLFKKQYLLLVNFTKEDPVAKAQSYAQLVRLTVWARNNQLTISGKTPLELAFGRRPPDLLDAEGENPEQLTRDPLEADVLESLQAARSQGSPRSQTG